MPKPNTSQEAVDRLRFLLEDRVANKVARATGVTSQTIRNLKKGRNLPRTKTVNKLLSYLEREQEVAE